MANTGIFSCPPQGYSGLELVAWQQAEGLAKKGHDVTLYAAEGSRCDYAKLRTIGKPGQWNEQMAYDSYWNELPNYDVIVDHTWNKMSVILKLEGKLPKTPLLLWTHAPVVSMFQTLPPSDVKGICFVTISKDQQSHFEGLHGREARTCYNGVDGNVYKSLGLPRTKRFLFLARFSTIKGPDLSIEACKRAAAELDLIGDTQITGEPEYLQSCKNACDGKKIRIIGGISRGATVWWYSQAHAMTHLNQRFREPLGLAPLEAQLCGLPVVAWKYGALKETVKDGETGILVNSLDEATEAIAYYKDNPPSQQDRERCREWASAWSVDAMVDRCEVLCNEAIEKPW